MSKKPNPCVLSFPKGSPLSAAARSTIASLFPSYTWADGTSLTIDNSRGIGKRLYILEANSGLTWSNSSCPYTGGRDVPFFDLTKDFNKFVEHLMKAPEKPKIELTLLGRTVVVDETGVQFGCTKVTPDKLDAILKAYEAPDTTFHFGNGESITVTPGEAIETSGGDLEDEDVQRLAAAWRMVRKG